jgi:8-oxo-dGTP pyrophosphatase MutT (NUDIX family)
MPITTDKPSLRRLQYAALPYRQRQDGEVQIRLITSRETRRWVVPKGWPIKGLTPPQTAAREAYEEAGLIGAMSPAAAGLYSYEKRLSPTRSVPCDVMVFPMKVKRYVKKWPERLERVGFWFSAESAAVAVQEEGLAQIILQFAAALTARHAAKLAAREEERAAEAAAKLKAAAKPKAAGKGKAPAEIAAAPLADGAAEKAEPEKAEPKKAEPKKADVKKADVKKAKAKNAGPETVSVPPSAAAKGPFSDEAGGAGPGGAAGGGPAGKAGTDTARAKKSPNKRSPEKSPAQKQPAKARDGKAGNVQAHEKAPDTGPLNAAPERPAAIAGTVGPDWIALASAALPESDSAKPTLPKMAPAKVVPARAAADETGDSKKLLGKKAGTKKAGGKKAGGKKAEAKKAGGKSGTAAASGGAGAAGAGTPARPSDAMTSNL